MMVQSMKFDKKAMLLYAVTDRMWINGRTLCDDVEKAIKGGVTMVQLREKELGFDEFLAEALEIKELCKKYRIPFIINDDVEVALACDADGIHIGQNDMDTMIVRKRLGEKKIIGVSAQTLEQAVLAEKGGADYLGVGAVFNTSTKSDADFVPYETLTQICNAVTIPVCAIGGIYDYNMTELSGSGIDGVALVSAIFAAENIEAECKKLRTLSDEIIFKNWSV